MKVYHYDDKYAKENGVDGVKELIATLCIGIAGTVAPATLMGLDMISIPQGLLIIGFTVLLGGILLRRLGIIQRAAMSALLDTGGSLYYITVTPNLRGSSVPRSLSAAMAGSSATYAENSLDASIAASNAAQSDEVILQLFQLFQDGKIKTNFDTLMYGKPVTVCELLDRDFGSNPKKLYRVPCIKNKKRRTTVRIPRVFPAFFA